MESVLIGSARVHVPKSRESTGTDSLLPRNLPGMLPFSELDITALQIDTLPDDILRLQSESMPGSLSVTATSGNSLLTGLLSQTTGGSYRTEGRLHLEPGLADRLARLAALELPEAPGQLPAMSLEFSGRLTPIEAVLPEINMRLLIADAQALDLECEIQNGRCRYADNAELSAYPAVSASGLISGKMVN